MKISLFAVIDGHGGEWCAHFIRKRLESEVRNHLNDSVHGFRK
jgi:serine/threonine protein phosphatase PrpC